MNRRLSDRKHLTLLSSPAPDADDGPFPPGIIATACEIQMHLDDAARMRARMREQAHAIFAKVRADPARYGENAEELLRTALGEDVVAFLDGDDNALDGED